jgi:hypothetical protein
MRTLTVKEIKEALEKHAFWLIGKSEGQRAEFSHVDFTETDFNFIGINLWNADLRYANLQGVDLRSANLQYANLQDVNLQSVDLRSANLQYIDLRSANLRDANLQYADLRNANLRHTDLKGADLRNANLQGADIDYSCLPLWYGSFNIKIDKRIAAQLLYHFCRMECDDKEVIECQNHLLPLANQFHIISGHGCTKLTEKNTI